MLPAPKRLEIDHRTIKLIVGVVAISISPLTSVLAKTRIDSVSQSYFENGWSQSVFIGFLFAISALLLAYNGYSKTEMVLSKVAAFAGLGIVLFPCSCGRPGGPAFNPHYFFAGVMFVILAFFCYAFSQRARAKRRTTAARRAAIYMACGIAILLAIVILGINGLAHDPFKDTFPRLTFYGEALGLVAFGISWLTASRVLPFITSEDERFSPLRATNPA
jgi:hypothetical protein